MKHRILFFGAVLVFLVSMCGCNAEKTDVSDNSDTAEISSSAGKAEIVTEYEPESDTKPTETDTEPTSEATEPAKAPTSSKNAAEAEKPTESVLPKPEETKPTVSSDTKEPDKPAQPEKTSPTEQPTEETKQKTAYDYEFDIEAIRSDLIAVGQAMGLTHIVASKLHGVQTILQFFNAVCRFHEGTEHCPYKMQVGMLHFIGCFRT